ncbi:ferrous iron transport protein B [Methylococcus sp. ANG]|uniref:ferrous iron transport protein B n=1 Tax=Methylococcus sp. ANG TaxID=3231903 RepID=UPI00345B0BDA
MNRAQKKHESILTGLAGQPNVGKSTVFNLLTGLSQHVGNWPGKTVERREGTLRHNGALLHLIDLPGIYSLTANSLEERIARDFILHEHPDVIILIANASALERSLYLLAELLLLPTPVVLGLNMTDIAEAEGIEIEPHVLEAALGLPVIPLVASRAQGVATLLTAAVKLAREPETFNPARPEIAPPHREALTQVYGWLDAQVPSPYEASWVALKLLEGDSELTDLVTTWLPEASWREIKRLLMAHEDAVLDIASGRYEWIGRMVRAAVKQPRLGQVSMTDRLDRYAIHPVWGMLILATVLALVLGLTFQVGSPLQMWLEQTFIEPSRARLAVALSTVPWWLAGLLNDGLMGGAGTVITFLPILTVFFAALAVLEDTGYLVRAAYLMDRFMHRIGLHGKSFLPLFLGFGCNVPAVMGARVIESQSGRLLTILLAPLVPCSARLQVLAFLTPVFFGQQAVFVASALIAVNILVLGLLGLLLNWTVFRGQHMVFIMELPLYHRPNFRAIGLFVWENLWSFLRRAATVILLVSVVVWGLSHFPGPSMDHSILAQFGRGLAPVGELMGMDWRMIVALLTSFIAKENAVATLAVLYTPTTEPAALATTLAASISPPAGLAFLTVTMLFIPCVATVAVMLQETRSWLWTLFGVALLMLIATAAGLLVYQGAVWAGLGTRGA